MSTPSQPQQQSAFDATVAEAVSPSESVAVTQEIDARGISSPLHVLRAHRALRAMQPGEVLRIVTDSEQTIAEFQALVKYVVGYDLLSQERVGDDVVHLLRKKR